MSSLADAAEAQGRGLTATSSSSSDSASTAAAGLSTWAARLKVSLAKSRSVRGSNYIQIATVCAETGRPRNRTVVFRGLRERTGALEGIPQLKMITDTRSEKAAHIASNPACEAVYWFAKTSEQYRIDGDLILVDSLLDDSELQAARLEQWKKLSDPAREQFWWDAPGEWRGPPSDVPAGGREAAAVRQDDDGDDAPVAATAAVAGTGKILPPPANFALLLLEPVRVKYLRLTDNLAIQDEGLAGPGEPGGDWVCTRINP